MQSLPSSRVSHAPGFRWRQLLHDLSVWRRIELAALTATIPAFYLSLLALHRSLALALYLLAFAASAAVTWQETRIRAAEHPESTAARGSSRRLGVLLAVALLLAALLPHGANADLLILRFGAAALTLLRVAETALPRAWRSGLPQLLALGIGVLSLCGLGFWWLEPRAHTFGDGLWLAFTTAATVGYGDIVPSTPAAKIFAVFVVLLGLSVLSLVTASIAALWVKTEERRIEHEILRDLHRELRTIKDELAALRAGAALRPPTVPADTTAP